VTNPSVLVARVRESVFDVKLKVVEAKQGEFIEDLDEVSHGGHAIARDIQQHASLGEARSGVGGSGRDWPASCEMQQMRDCVTKHGRCRSRDDDR
jgi:hypothetical protein